MNDRSVERIENRDINSVKRKKPPADSIQTNVFRIEDTQYINWLIPGTWTSGWPGHLFDLMAATSLRL